MTEETQEKKWYQKKRYAIPFGIAGVFLISAIASSNSTPAPTPVTPSSFTQTYATPTATPFHSVAPEPTLSNNNYYTNVNRNTVHSPAYAPSIPSSATGVCRDGQYTFATHHQGACSHHEGVSYWL